VIGARRAEAVPWVEGGGVRTPQGELIVLGNSLAGYAQATSGRRVVFMIAVGNVPISTAAEFLQVTNDQAEMVVAIQQLL
jgi:hypothetical protein